MAAMPTMNMPAMRNEVKLSPAGGGVYRGTGQVLRYDGSGTPQGKVRAMVEAKHVIWDVIDSSFGDSIQLGDAGFLEEIDYALKRYLDMNRLALQAVAPGDPTHGLDDRPAGADRDDMSARLHPAAFEDRRRRRRDEDDDVGANHGFAGMIDRAKRVGDPPSRRWPGPALRRAA